MTGYLYNNAVNNFWSERIMSQFRLNSSLKYLSKTYTVGKCHPAGKPYTLSSRDICRIPVKNKILTGTFIVLNSIRTMSILHASGVMLNQKLKPTFRWLECRILETVRKPILAEFKKVFSDVVAEIYTGSVVGGL